MDDLFTTPPLWESNRVKFYEFGHKYLLDGSDVLIGVTSLMKKHGLSPDYSGISEEVLAHAANLGSQAHKRIEDYCDGKPVPESRLIKSFKKLGLNIVRCEYLVTDEESVASSIDLLNEDDPGVYDIIDMKRTSSVHKDALAWQLGIYRYLFLLNNPWAEVRGCYCLPIKKGNKDDIEADVCGKLVPIKPVPMEDVEALLQAEKDGDIYARDALDVPMVLADEDVAVAVECAKKLEEYKATIKEIETTYNEVLERMYDTMLSKDIDKIDAGGVTITLKRPYTRNSFDTKKFAADHPTLFDQYVKTTETKGNVSIKLK